MKRIIRSLDHMFLFAAAASSTVLFICLFSVFLDLTSKLESPNAQITGCIITLTYIYWLIRGLMYWAIKSSKQSEEAK